jgi:hypothetical protein
VVPSVENQLPVSTPGLVFFRIYNLSADPQQRKIVATVRLLGEKGEQLDFPPIPLDQYIVPAGRTEVIVAMNLPFEKVAPGKYKLVIEATDTASNQSVMVQTDLELK